MFDTYCPNCGREFSKATVGTGVFLFHVAAGPDRLGGAEPGRVEYHPAPERETDTDTDFPGLYQVAATATTTTTTMPAPVAALDPPGRRPSPGFIVARNKDTGEWGEVPDCGYSI